MMKKVNLIIMSLTFLFFYSCSGENHDNREHDGVHNHDETVEHKQDVHSQDMDNKSVSQEDVEKLVLNHGEKWQLSESLMAAAGEMADDVSAFYKAHKSTLDDYHALAEKLSGGINKLVNKCELPDGEAHENLHKWLHPYMEDVAALKKVDNDADARKQLEKIRKSFITFKMFFK